MIRTVGEQPHLRTGAVFGRWTALQHGQCDALPLQPIVTFRLCLAAPARQCLLYAVHALVETIAAEVNIGWIGPHGFHPMTRSDHIEPSNRKRIEPEYFGQIDGHQPVGLGHL